MGPRVTCLWTAAAAVLVISGAAWGANLERAQLYASDGDSVDWFGGAVSIDGSTVAVGARADDDPDGTRLDMGSVYCSRLGPTALGTIW